MLRSFLARPHPLLSGRLRRHDCRSLAQLGRDADQIISRSYTSSESEEETDSDADRPEAKPVAPNCRTSTNHRKRHLYVALDDWKKGFSVHKLDLDDGSDGRDLTLRPPAYRQAADCLLHWNFAAVGSKIVAAGEINDEELGKEGNGVTLLYDTETAGLSIVPRLPAALRVPWWCLTAAAKNRLYTFEDISNSKKNTQQYNVAMHCLEEGPPRPYWLGTSEHWSWKIIPSPPPFNTCETGMVSSIAVHPEGEGEGGRHIFVSAGNNQTYSYNVESREWRHHGEWGLPFDGQADYDMELDAWVGLSNLDDYYICCCDIVSPNGSSLPAPAWKLCRERLFNPNTEYGTSLVYMGKNTYCLVKVEELDTFKVRRCAGPGNKCTICLSMFRLMYDKNGELTITARQPDRSYHFSKYSEDFQVQAFWV